MDQNSKFILGNHKGLLHLYQSVNGERLRALVGHANEITALQMDYANQLLITAGWDAALKIQRLSQKGKTEVIREISNCF
jgi:hypothetical protein